MVTRRVADNEVLRSNTALNAYIQDLGNLLFNINLELQVVARASKGRLKKTPVKASINYREKVQAANQVTRALRNAARAQNVASSQLGKAQGIMQAVFVNQPRGNQNQNRGNRNNNSGNGNNSRRNAA